MQRIFVALVCIMLGACATTSLAQESKKKSQEQTLVRLSKEERILQRAAERIPGRHEPCGDFVFTVTPSTSTRRFIGFAHVTFGGITAVQMVKWDDNVIGFMPLSSDRPPFVVHSKEEALLYVLHLPQDEFELVKKCYFLRPLHAVQKK